MNRHIPFARLHNFRDLGGYATEDGRTVRPGLLFRADSLGKLTGRDGAKAADAADVENAADAADWGRFLSLGIRTVLDLRYPWEIEARGRVPEHPSLAYHNLSIEHRPYDQATLPASVAAGPYLAERYLEVAEDGTKEIRETLQLIGAAAQSGAPLVFHCASGKDRTGLVAALVLALLDVPERTIVEDFALTERATPRLVADWHAANPTSELTWPAYATAPAEVMTLFLAALNTRYGSVQGYATETLKLDPAFPQALRTALLDRSS
ncbi:tyrosine-protein phosphatase [Streptomyces sp. NPDC058371]|uniref:tyrosine-protein phosphatase n=1 Tax=Streptomyces sp. NPDC058371 TaxID=3346463 RepID=UPI003646928B